MKPRLTYANVISTLALVFAVTTGGAYAANNLIDSGDIRNGSVRSADITKSGVKSSDLGAGAVRSTDIKTAAVQSSDIGQGEVEPVDVTMPDPRQLVLREQKASDVGENFGLVATVGSYDKQAADSQLRVTWTGTAQGFTHSCVFQLRVDGQASATGAGVLYVGTSIESVSAAALFAVISTGPHSIEIWARAIAGPGSTSSCIVGPAGAGIDQTVVLDEIVT